MFELRRENRRPCNGKESKSQNRITLLLPPNILNFHHNPTNQTRSQTSFRESVARNRVFSRFSFSEMLLLKTLFLSFVGRRSEKMEKATEIDCRSGESKFPLAAWEIAAASTVVLGFGLGLFCVYLTMPDSDYSFLKLPRSLEDLHVLRGHLEDYTSDYTIQVLVGYCVVYIFMQTFMIPGTVFLSLLAGSLFGVFKGVALVVFTATAGASCCYFLSKFIGKPLVFSLWPDKLSFFQAQVAKRRKKLLNYMLFLRVTPTLPNTFINVASPIVDVPYPIFFLATFIGLIPAAFVTVRAGIALGELRSVGDLYDFQSIAAMFLIGVVSVTPTLISKGKS